MNRIRKWFRQWLETRRRAERDEREAKLIREINADLVRRQIARHRTRYAQKRELRALSDGTFHVDPQARAHYGDSILERLNGGPLRTRA